MNVSKLGCWRGMLLLALVTGGTLAALPAQRSSAPLGSGNGLLLQAKQAEERHDFTRAAGYYQEFLTLNPNSPKRPGVLQSLGIVYYLSNQFRQAIPVLRRAVAGDASLWGSYLFLGISYYRTGRFKDARAALLSALKIKPGLSEAQFWLGSTLIAEGRPEAAVPYLQRASKTASLGVESDALLLRAYREAAEDSYRRVTKLGPDSARAHQIKARALSNEGNPGGALLEFHRAIECDPGLEGPHREMGELYWQERQFGLAAQQFAAELRLNPLDAEANLRMGEYELAMHHPAQAAKFLKTALKANTERKPEALHFLAIAEKSAAASQE